MKTQIRYKLNGKILTIAVVGLVMVCTSCLMLVFDPLQMIVRKLLAMAPGSIFYKLWQQPPYDVVMKLYIFNVTNPQEFLAGTEKMNITQVGPYAYKEVLTHNNVSFNDDGTVTFRPNRDYSVDMENSVGDASLERLIIPNIPLLGIQAYLKDSFFSGVGFSTLSASLGAQSFMNVTVEEYLWGYEDKLVTMANQFIPSWIDFKTFGLLARLISRDNNNEVTISVDPGKRTSKYNYLLTEEEEMSPFHIVKWNGSPGLKEWGFVESDRNDTDTKKCQLVEGDFDGTIFPRPMRENRNLFLFRKAFCRPVELEFIEQSYTKQGFKSFNFRMKKDMFASPEENPMNECYCHNGVCPSGGLQSIAPCYYDIPIVLSQPHFLNADRKYLDAVNGLSPNEEIHASIAKVQPDLGVPLDESTLRIQVNLGIGETKYNSRTKPFNNMVVPLFWIELTCGRLPSLVSFLLTLVIDIVPILTNVMIYLFGLLGLAMISASALLTLFFTKTVVPRLSMSKEYSPVPLIQIPSQYFKEQELKLLISKK